MKKKKPIIITTAVIILCIITLILGIKVVQKKKEVQTKQELIQSQQELINYIKNDGMNVENKGIYIIRIEKVTTKEELDPIRQEYEKEAEKSIDQNYYCFCPFDFAALSSGRWLSSNGTLHDPISGDRL